MTIKELYSKDFETAVTELSYENDYITSIEVLKDFIVCNIQNDSLCLAAHVLDVLLNYYTDYYSYDYSMGTLETPKPLTEIEDLEEFCEDYKENKNEWFIFRRNETGN